METPTELRPPVVGRHVFYAGEEVMIRGSWFRIKSMNRRILRLRAIKAALGSCRLIPGQVVRIRSSRFRVKKWDGRNLKLKLTADGRSDNRAS